MFPYTDEQVETAARVAHEVNRAYCNSIGDHSQPAWHEAPGWQRSSAIEGVRQIATNPDTTPEQSHANWMREKIDAGWIYGANKDPEAKTHPALVSYDRLPRAQRIKDALFGAAVRAALNMPVPQLSA